MMMMFQDQDFIGMPPSAIYQFRAFLGARSIMLDDVDDEPFTDGISSPIAQHIYDFCDDGNGGDLFAAVSAAAAGSDMFTASSEDASASSSSTATAPIAGGDNLSPPLPSLDSTLSALLEQDEPPGADAELLLPIDDYAFAAVDETQPPPEQQQQFTQMPLPVMGAAAEHPALQGQLSSTATELMQYAGFSDEVFAAALAAGAGAGAGAGGYMGLDEPLCPQQHSGAMLPASGGEAFFSKDAHAAQAAFFAAGGGGGGSMVMSMMGMDEIGEYQRMIECGGALLGGTHAADGADMTFGNAAATAEMQMGGSGSPARLPATGTTETSSLEDTSFKTVRLSNEERKEKIHRYIKKRNERNFSKKIKYACRKTLADSRPRVRGRFAKNDDYCEASRSIGSQNHEEYEQIGGVKGEDMIDSDALAHISGMSSYMYNHTVESWI
uniref:CCT domain-containing protein n=1 Tax=Oryza punctata TaxID=4537 RepID=A0A0E0M8H6_ORYPU